MQNLKRHELSAICGDMAEADFDAFAEDVKAHGLTRSGCHGPPGRGP